MTKFKHILLTAIAALMTLSATARATNDLPNLFNGVDLVAMNNWVDSVFDSMSDDARIGQLFVAAVTPDGKDATRELVKRLVSQNLVGGLIYEESTIAPQVMEVIGGSPHFPSGYKLKTKTDDFVWVADVKQYTQQGVFIYKYPALKEDNFSVENIIAKRNEVLKNNVPGMFENTYMTTAEYINPTVQFVKYKGREFAETRGYWEVQGDYMGGPFVSHSFYSQDGSEIIVTEAFLYAPRYDKRQYLRQVESLLYSFEWKKD